MTEQGVGQNSDARRVDGDAQHVGTEGVYKSGSMENMRDIGHTEEENRHTQNKHDVEHR
jgi:hypothetical protein